MRDQQPGQSSVCTLRLERLTTYDVNDSTEPWEPRANERP